MTTKPTVELKKIEVHVGLSDETPAYTAKLYVNGEHFADVSNQGHGGCDMTYPPKGEEKGFQDRFVAMDKLVGETYPQHDFGDYPPMDECLEVLCHNAVWEHVERRNFRSKLSRKVLVRRDGNVYEIKGKKSAPLMDAAVKKYGEENVLNKMDFEAAWGLINVAA